MFEKHHDYFRYLYLRVRKQCTEECITDTHGLFVGICITAKNSLLSVGNSTPAQAVCTPISEIACEDMLQVISEDNAE